MKEPKRIEFNQALIEAFDEVVSELLGSDVLDSLYLALKNRYTVSKDELPYRLDTAYSMLEHVFGFKGVRTIGNRIARRLYERLSLEFNDDDRTLLDYVEDAKRKLAAK